MSEYKFRLNTLLKIRAADRQQRRVELAQAYQAEGLLNQRVEQLTLEREALRGAARVSVAPGAIHVDRLLSAHRYELLLETQVKLLEQQGVQVQEEIERRRAALVDADREVRVLEKLRERQREAHQTAEWKQELKDLDEIAQRSSWSKPE